MSKRYRFIFKVEHELIKRSIKSSSWLDCLYYYTYCVGRNQMHDRNNIYVFEILCVVLIVVIDAIIDIKYGFSSLSFKIKLISCELYICIFHNVVMIFISLKYHNFWFFSRVIKLLLSCFINYIRCTAICVISEMCLL